MKKYPIFLQDDEVSCGAYCLLMVLKYYGYQEEIQRIKELCRVNAHGISIKGMIECLKAYQIEAKAYEANIDNLMQEATFPCVLYVLNEGLGHFVVLYEVKDDEFVIGDPSRGLLTMFRDELEKIYMNRMINITHVGRVPETSYQSFYKYLLLLYDDYHSVMKSLIFKGFMIAGMGYVSSFFYRILLDYIDIKTPLFYMIVLCLVYGLVDLVKTRMDYIRQETMIELKRVMDEEHVYRSSMNLMSLPYTFFYQDKGQIQSQLSSFAEISDIGLGIFERVFLDLVSFVVFIIGMVLIEIRMVLGVFIILVGIGVLSYHSFKELHRLQKQNLEAHFIYQHHLLELIENHSLIRMFNYQQAIKERSYHYFMDQAMAQQEESMRLNSYQHRTQYLIYIGYMVVMIVGFIFYKKELLTIGEVLMFFMLLSYCIDPLVRLISLFIDYKQMTIIYDKYKAFQIDKYEEKDVLKEPIQSITFDNVGYAFGYQLPLFEHVDLHISRHLLLQGVTGSGKSTLLKLLMGFDDKYTGDIYINDQELRTIELSSLYECIGYMDQTPTFLHMSVFDNFLCEDEKKVRDYLKVFKQEDLIDLFHIVLDEQGAPLSLGQRQVVALIRLLCRDYDVYIFDEAFSHMDYKLANRVQRYLLNHDEGKLYIMVNHQTKIVKKGWDCAIIDDRKLVKKGDIMAIDFVYEDENSLCEDSFEQQFIEIIEMTLNHLHINDDVELSCIIVDDEEIHHINNEYRHIDRSTDVISFALEDNDQFYVEGMPRSLGDIFISIEHAKAQAKEYGHSLKREMCFLFTHGLLHLLGYDHMIEDDEKVMFTLQEEILSLLHIERV